MYAEIRRRLSSECDAELINARVRRQLVVRGARLRSPGRKKKRMQVGSGIMLDASGLIAPAADDFRCGAGTAEIAVTD